VTSQPQDDPNTPIDRRVTNLVYMENCSLDYVGKLVAANFG